MSKEFSKAAFLWAVDPFQTDVKPDASSVRRLEAWADKAGFDIKPIYILSKTAEGLEEFERSEKQKLADRLSSKAQKYLSSIGATKAEKLKVLSIESEHERDLAHELTKLASRFRTPCIVVSSHGRSGWNRLVFGSFAEKILKLSTKPVLFLSHKTSGDAPAGKLERILFPTDFSASSHTAFKKLLELASRAEMEIILFYANVWPILTTSVEVPLVLPPNFLEEQERAAKKTAENWILEAEESDVKARLLSEDCVGSYEVATRILTAAEGSKADMISLSCTSSMFSAFVNGSVSRDVFRHSSWPVLVFGPACLDQEIVSTNMIETSETV